MSNRWSRHWITVGLVALMPQLAVAQSHKELDATAVSAVAPGTTDELLYSCKRHTGPVTVTLKPETEVRDLVTWVMSFTCKNFVLDPRIVSTGRKVSVIAPTVMSADDAYRMFLVVISTIGLTVVSKGNVMRVVEAAAAKKEALPIYKQVPGDSDQMVRVVVWPSYAQPEALKTAFLAIKSDAGEIAVIGAALIVTDYASTISEMMSLKKLVDVRGGTEGIYTIPVHHGDATKVAQMLTQMFGAQPAGPAPPVKPGAEPAAAGASEPVPSKILADERTNTLVLSASEPAYLRAKALVDRLDVAVELEAGGSIHTYQLTSAIAEELAQTLTKAITGDAGAARAQRPTTGTQQVPGPPQAPAASALDSLGATLQGSVHVIGDKATNKLLITSSTHDYLAIKDVVHELDQPRREVYIEAMILEVDVTNDLAFGASAHAAGSTSTGGVGFGGVQLPSLSSLDPSTALKAGGLLGGLLGPTLGSTLLGTSVPSYGVLVQALATRSNTNILSTPSLIAVDNEEAKSKIGQNIPYIRGTIPALTGTTSAATVTNIDRKDLDLELDIKPHISADDTVLLEITHNAANIKDPNGVNGPTWTTREIQTRVVVRDQQTVMIGGLMQETETDSAQQVPILGDIPLLGYLFKYTAKSKHKTNLLILLTPYIIRDHTDLQRIQERKQRQNEEFFGSVAQFDSMKFQPTVDYARKRGVIEEINRAVLDVEVDLAARAAIAAPAGIPAGPVEPASAEPKP
jgi:general secretion pathway protein D